MDETERQTAPSKRSAAQRLLIEAGGDTGGRGEKCERSVSTDLSAPSGKVARPSALGQLADRVAAGVLVTRIAQSITENSLAQHDALMSGYWSAIDNIEFAHGRLN